ncbi:MAG: hypothetical protein ABI638_09515, partial [Ignavibacteriota bacterium]
MKKSLLLFFFAFAVGTISFAQTVSLKTFGVTPRDVSKDTVEQYFDRAYNSLLNVGKETKVFLQGTSTVALSGASWNFSTKPTGSNATFGAVKDLDTSN